MANFVVHPIKDNKLLINNQVYVGLGVAKIVTGVENKNKQEIVKNPETGLNTRQNAVEAQEVYKFSTQKFSGGFILDLETGSRGWFPGCQIHGFIFGTDVEVKVTESEESETIAKLSNVPVIILNILDVTDIPESGFYKIKYDSIVGYVRSASINNIKYAAPI